MSQNEKRQHMLEAYSVDVITIYRALSSTFDLVASIVNELTHKSKNSALQPPANSNLPKSIEWQKDQVA